MARRTDDGDGPHNAEILYIVPREDGAGERYFFSDAEMDAAMTPDVIARALALAGAWSDLDWEETASALDRIRHASTPTPPLDDLG